MSHPKLLLESMRWFGPDDPVPLAFIRQAGAQAVFSALHHIPYGEIWSQEEILKRKAEIESAGLRWAVAESLPVHEDIKVGQGDLKTLLSNYTDSLKHLASAGVQTVVYNFMPALDWVRTDMSWQLADGSRSMRYDPVRFAAFEIHALQRHGAEQNYTDEQLEAAEDWWLSLGENEQAHFIASIIDVFPGVKWQLNLDDIRKMLQRYQAIDEMQLRRNLQRFLGEVIPVAETHGIRMAIHPDDPPFPVLGLPRIVSTADDIQAIFAMADSPANGLCFCSGSFSARADNDLPAMASALGPRIHAVHLRSTMREADGSFHEASHLEGSVNMPALMQVLLAEQDRRHAEGRQDHQLPMRPDHGNVMMDDLTKPIGITPGYSCIGRMKGLAELRGLAHGLRYGEG